MSGVQKEGGRDEYVEKRGSVGQQGYSSDDVINGGYVLLHICQNPQNVQHRVNLIQTLTFNVSTLAPQV